MESRVFCAGNYIQTSTYVLKKGKIQTLGRGESLLRFFNLSRKDVGGGGGGGGGGAGCSEHKKIRFLYICIIGEKRKLGYAFQ